MNVLVTGFQKRQKKGEVRDTLCRDLKAKELLNWKPTRNLEDYIN